MLNNRLNDSNSHSQTDPGNFDHPAHPFLSVSSAFIIFQILDVDTSRNRSDQNSVSLPRKQESLKQMNADETDKAGCTMP
jgi:hypothetical protein